MSGYRAAVLAATAGLALVAGCSPGTTPAAPPAATTATAGPSASTTSTPAPTPSTTTGPPTSPSTAGAPTTTPSTTSAVPTPTTPKGPTPSDGRPVRALLSIPALGLTGLVVEPYPGRTDDRPGTVLQDRGFGAAPYGPEGGTGPGGVGNYQVTGHRTSANAPFRTLPGLPLGEVIHVDAAGTRYTYRVTESRQTSFRSAQSLAEQRAQVPGRPGVAPTQAMITVSTCLTPEDHAAGNFWSDENHNPEHRADKIGVLVATAPAPA